MERLQSIIAKYDAEVKGINAEAESSDERAYGGIIRASKGKLVEYIARELVDIAWIDVLGQDPSRFSIDNSKIPIGISDCYVTRIANPQLRQYVLENRKRLVYKFGTDVHVKIDGRIVLPIECKAYAENAMIKRILFDANLMKEAVGTDRYYLLQLESQLGGDYCELKDVTFGSPATHALMAHVDVDLVIITLLKGERKVDRPIHKQEFFKPLTMESLDRALNVFVEALKPYAG